MKKYILHTLTLILLSACSGDINFLDERPDKSRVVPESLEDLQNLLDNYLIMNRTPGLGEFASDDIYTTDEGFDRYYYVTLRNTYTWEDDIYEGEHCSDWSLPYEQIFTCNVVLEELGDHERNKRSEQLKATALFYRAHAYYQLLQIFAPPYEGELLPELLGVPIQKSSDIKENAKRASLDDCYSMIITDLKQAVPLLPEYDPIKSRPCVYSAYALLSRVYLVMNQYEDALNWGEKVLEGPYQLMDYSSKDTATTYPFETFNEEIIWHSEMLNLGYHNRSWTLVDTHLLELYEENDLRKKLFFRERSYGVTAKGGYTGSPQWFSGLTLDEIYLVVSECYLRMNEIDKGLSILNILLSSRWVPGTHIPLQTVDKEEALKLLLEERRKELVFRGINWVDLRRLNLDSKYARKLKRVVKGKVYELIPGSPKYTFPIPIEELRYNDIIQNKR